MIAELQSILENIALDIDKENMIKPEIMNGEFKWRMSYSQMIKIIIPYLDKYNLKHRLKYIDWILILIKEKSKV
jgi:hypothetical protein